MSYALRTRAALTVVDPALLLARAHLLDPTATSEYDALRALVLAVDAADLAEDAEEYGLAVDVSVTVLSATEPDEDGDGHGWVDAPFADVTSDRVLAHLIDTGAAATV